MNSEFNSWFLKTAETQPKASTEFIFKNRAIRCSQLKKFQSGTKIVDFRRRIQAQAYTMFAGKFPGDRDQDCTFERCRCEIRYLKERL
jgi:hypothetical protein